MLTCPGYVARYIIWINATDRAAAKELLERHVFYCPECQRQAAELTRAAQAAQMPPLDGAIKMLDEREMR